MSEGPGVTASSVPPGRMPRSITNPRTEGSAEEAANPPEHEEVEPHVRVDGRRLESALLALRHLIVEVPLHLEAPGVDEARGERRKLAQPG